MKYLIRISKKNKEITITKRHMRNVSSCPKIQSFEE
jgi:hypothetical protein